MVLLVLFVALSACGDDPAASVEEGSDDLVWDFEVAPFECGQNTRDIATLYQVADHASNVEFGPCGHLVYRDEDGTGWLLEPSLGDDPLNIGHDVISMHFSPHGDDLAVLVGDEEAVTVSRIDLETGNATDYSIETSINTFGYGFRTVEGGSALYACGGAELHLLEHGETTSLATDVSDCRRTFGEETGPTLVYTTEGGTARVANLNTGTVADLFSLVEPQTQEEEVSNIIYTSRDGTLLTHVFSRAEMCGDTYCGRSWARPYNLVSRERLGEVEHGGYQDVDYWIDVEQAAGHVASVNLGNFEAAIADPDFNFVTYQQTTVIHLLEDGSGAIIGQADTEGAYRTESIALLDFADGSRTRIAGGSPTPYFVLATTRGSETVLTYPTENGVALHNLEQGVISCETGQHPEPEWIGSGGAAIWTTSLADYMPGEPTPRAAFLLSSQGDVLDAWESGFWSVAVFETQDALLLRYSTRDEHDISASASTLRLIDPANGRGITLASQTIALADVDDSGERLWYTVRDPETAELPSLWVGGIPSGDQLEPSPELPAELAEAVSCGDRIPTD